MNGALSAAIRIGVASARVNLVPMCVLWTIAAELVGAYGLVPSFRAVLDPFAAWHAAWGWKAAFLCQAFFCGLLPGLFLVLFRGIRPRRTALTILAQTLWCGTFGIGVGEVFRLLAAWFGRSGWRRRRSPSGFAPNALSVSLQGPVSFLGTPCELRGKEA